MKKNLALFLAVLLLFAMMAGCGSTKTEEKKLSVVTTIFPVYDWVRNVLGENAENAELTFLLDSGVDLHSYQPTADDLITIANCDLFLYVGGESDEWVEDALEAAGNPDRKVLNLMEVLGSAAVKPEELVEGMEAEEEEDADEPEYDEHIWLSLNNAALLTDAIKNALSEIDPAHQDAYRSNAEAYIQALQKLNLQYIDTVQNASCKTLLFADRFPFRYLADDYGISYYAAFAGCSAESEASFETVAFLAGKVDELGLPAVVTLEGSDGKIAQTVIDTVQGEKPAILTMDSLQSVTDTNADYCTIMEQNLAVLQQALQ